MYTKKLTTLCLILNENNILLAMKKRGHGEGFWNGYGGKVQAGESIEAAMKREVKEELGVVAQEYENRGVIIFEFQGDPELIETHLYSIIKYEGKPSESEEMKPEWFAFDKIPYDQMWPADIQWIPLFIEGHNIKADILFDKDKKLIAHRVQVE